MIEFESFNNWFFKAHFFQAEHRDLRYQMPFINQLISFQYVAPCPDRL